jgi:diphosphomevalonate decarboxylase
VRATARACANIALVKYWGKRDLALNLPAAGSLSLTLDRFETVARVELDASLREDEVEIDGQSASDGERWRVSQFLGLVRAFAGRTERVRAELRSNFPVGAGLASSASSFGALSLAASRACGVDLSRTQLSALARRGSGSAARSIFGGFVEMGAGTRPDGADAVAKPVAPPTHWDVRMVVALTSEGRKALGSTEAMIRTAETSPLYEGWLASVPRALHDARAAVLSRDLASLGATMEHSALTMHATALAARPPVLYWHPGTIDVVNAVWALRKAGVDAYFTIDAGPNVKVLCAAGDAARVDETLRSVRGVLRTFIAAPGPAAELVDGA